MLPESGAWIQFSGELVHQVGKSSVPCLVPGGICEVGSELWLHSPWASEDQLGSPNSRNTEGQKLVLSMKSNR